MLVVPVGQQLMATMELMGMILVLMELELLEVVEVVLEQLLV